MGEEKDSNGKNARLAIRKVGTMRVKGINENIVKIVTHEV